MFSLLLKKRCFVDILKKYGTIIENKDTDGSSLKQKNEAWERIAAEFNTSPHAISQASSKQLRRLWMNLKQRQRESLTKERQHRLATGGGPSTSDADIDPDVSSIAPALIVGIDTAIDSDTMPAKEEIYMVIDDQDSTVTTPEPPLLVETIPIVTEYQQSPGHYILPIISQTSTTPPATPSLPTPHPSSRPQSVTTQRHKNNILEMEYQNRKKRADEKHEIEMSILQEQQKRADEKHSMDMSILQEQRKRADEKHVKDMLILQEQLKEAKAKAKLAEKKLHEEGSQCYDSRGKNGTCVNAWNCLSVVGDVRKREYPKICSFQGQTPIVCCTDCFKVRHIKNAIIDKQGAVHFRTGKKAYDGCLEHLANLPIDGCGTTSGLVKYWNKDGQCYRYSRVGVLAANVGKDAKRGQFPHMALLGYGERVEHAEWLCGGSLISDKFVLTAGHCISSVIFGKVRFIAMGILKRTDPPERWHRYKVKNIIPHPEYHAPSKYHDIALLETSTRVKFNPHVFPACLNIDDFFYGVVTATGWGAMGHNKQRADTLQIVSLQSFYDEICTIHYPPHRNLLTGYNSTIQLCYGDERGTKDTCEGDSGGPLQAKPGLSTCLHTVIGVTSYGRDCGYKGQPGIYTRVSFYVPWIENIVWP